LKVLEALFIFCMMWSLGAMLVQRSDCKDRDRFDAFIKSIAALGTGKALTQQNCVTYLATQWYASSYLCSMQQFQDCVMFFFTYVGTETKL
jgi:dynein heavy chain